MRRAGDTTAAKGTTAARRSVITMAVAVSVVVVAAGCGTTRKGAAFFETPSPAGHSSGGAGATADGGVAYAAPSAAAPGGIAAGRAAESGVAAGGTAAEGTAAEGTAGTGTVPQAGSNVSIGLRAGSVDDNARFADYLAYRDAFAELGLTVHDFDVSRRDVFTITNRVGQPVIGADIVITDPAGHRTGELHTYADGRALWFPPGLQAQPGQSGTGEGQGQPDGGPFTATVTKDGATAHVVLDSKTRAYPVTLDAASIKSPAPLDIEFVVDATGSMGDEIAQLKSSLADISARIAALPAKPDVRFALTIYRDRVDDFLTRTWNFSSDLPSFQKAIAGVTAGGGGDYPEDVQQGLYDALHKPDWRGPGTVKLMFLMGDAPPHLDYSNDPDYVATAQEAARQGVKIESLAASGLDDQGEYVWRQVAELTMGQFLFLTYGPDGGPGDTTTHHVNGYTPMNLDDLIVGLVSQELSPAGGQSSGGGGQTSPKGQ